MAVYSTLLDRAFDYVLMMLMTGPALLYAGRLVSLAVAAGLTGLLVMGLFLVVATRFGLVIRGLNTVLGQVASWASRLPVLGRVLPQARVDRFRELADIEIDSQAAGHAYLLTIVQISMALLRSHFIGRALGIHLSLLLLLQAAPVAQLGQLLAFTPGALGIRELSWFAVLQASGIPRDDLLTFLVGHRAYIYVCILALSLISQLIMLIWARHPSSAPPSVGVGETDPSHT
jgi:uncharacterized protein (TIRG00374 family)